MYTSSLPSFIAREGCASHPIQAHESPHRQVTTRIISPCWFLEGGPQHDDGGGILGNGAGSSGKEGDGDDEVVGVFDVVDADVDLDEQQLTLGCVTVDNNAGECDEGGVLPVLLVLFLLLLQQPDFFITGVAIGEVDRIGEIAGGGEGVAITGDGE